MKKVLIFFLFNFLFISICLSQIKPRFWDDVQTIKAYDQMFKTPDKPILFIGSSSIRKWDDLQEEFGRYRVLNRGIGGAVTNDIIFYLNDLVFAYHPRQLVIFVGENDLPDETTTPDSILHRTQRLFSLIREKMPLLPIIYISIKPSPVRSQYLNKAKNTNLLIRNFLAHDKNVLYLDVFSKMLTKGGKTRPELFVKDQLHMNERGYAIWNNAIKTYLLKP